MMLRLELLNPMEKEESKSEPLQQVKEQSHSQVVLV